MNKRGKTIAAVVGLSILAIGGTALAFAGGKKTGICPDGMRPNLKRMHAIAAARTAAARAQASAMPVCVPIECPDGFERDAFDNCVSIEDPAVKFCPAGQHWDGERNECVADDDPTDCPPDQVFDVSTQSCRIKGEANKCPDGMRPNPARAAAIATAKTVAELTAATKLPACVPNDSPNEECPPGSTFVPAPFGPGGSCIPNDIRDIDDYIKDFPTDGAFYTVKAGDFPGWATAGKKTKSVAQNQLGSALLAAAREFGGLDGPAALAWANERRVNQAHTNAIYLANLCCGWNDMTVATYGYCGPIAAEALRCAHTAKQKPAATGRAIRFLKMHADNVARLKAGLPPARVVSIGSANKAGDGLPVKAVASADPGGSTSYPTMWLVGINRRVLWESDGAALEFDDDRALPPAFVMELGFTNYAGASADLPKYGCNAGGYNGEVVV